MKNLQLCGCSEDSAHLEVNNFLSSSLFKHKTLTQNLLNFSL